MYPLDEDDFIDFKQGDKFYYNYIKNVMKGLNTMKYIRNLFVITVLIRQTETYEDYVSRLNLLGNFCKKL